MYCWIKEHYIDNLPFCRTGKTILYVNNINLVLDYYAELTSKRRTNMY